MAINPASVAGAYQAAAKVGTGASAGAASTGSLGSAFEDALKNAVSNVSAGENAALQGVSSNSGDIINVVNAVNSAELTLNTVVAIRDKVISAYQNIMQMPI